MLKTQEHIDLVDMFEKEHRPVVLGRFDKEDKSMWPKGHIYQDMNVNALFLAYRKGYAYGKAVSRMEG